MSNQRTVDNSAQRLAALKQCTTLDQFVPLRASLTGGEIALKQFDRTTNTWEPLSYLELNDRIVEWRKALAGLGLTRGARVSILLNNSVDHVLADQAVLANAMIPVPLHAIDTPGSLSFILGDSGAECLITNKYERWLAIEAVREKLPALKTVILTDEVTPAKQKRGGPKIYGVDDFLALGHSVDQLPEGPAPEDLAAIVYTSGTTGKPKGVMLTHRALLANINGVLSSICPRVDEVWLSFLPLSHTLERIATYYLALGMGNLVAFNRNIGLLQEDMRVIRPTIMLSVPRVYEKIYSKIQDRLATQSPFVQKIFRWAVDVGWRRFCRKNGLPCPSGFSALFDPLVAGFLDRKVGAGIRNIFGGRPYVYISGGAAFNPTVAKVFLALGVEILQGYGMTEASPVVCVNKLGSNNPQTVGIPLDNLETKLGPNDELMVRGPNVMVGYWMRPEDPRAVLTEDGWLKTGDQADIYKSGHIRIKGRIKEIIVTSTGEKIPPGDLEQAIETDNLFDQVMAVGEDRPYIACLAVVNPEQFDKFVKELGKDPKDEGILMDKEVRNAALRRIKALTRDFPNYGIPRNVRLLAEPWTIESGLLTPTLKLKRAKIRERFHAEIDELYGDRRG